jgi:hypothetical protein
MTLETYNLVTEGSCRLSDVVIPHDSKMFTVQAQGFIYGGGSAVTQPHLPHCYMVPCLDMLHMRMVMLAEPPSIEPMKSNENLVIDYAVYDGIVTEVGLAQVLPRPIEEYYSPPSVMIVGDSEGRYRAILLDPAYVLLASNKLVCNEDAVLNALRADIRECMKDKNYSQADEKYRKFSAGCWRVLDKMDCN